MVIILVVDVDDTSSYENSPLVARMKENKFIMQMTHTYTKFNPTYINRPMNLSNF